MSIIHEALKKAQVDLQRNEKKQDDTIHASSPRKPSPKSSIKTHRRLIRLKFIFSGGLFALLIGGILITLPQHITSLKFVFIPHKNLAVKKPHKTNIAMNTSSNNKDSKLSLSGIVISGNKQGAIINHHLYQVGDSIDNMHIIAISVNKVELQDNQKIITLLPES